MGLITLAWLIGMFAIVIGTLVGLGFRLRGHRGSAGTVWPRAR
jgi:hypothetical protein